MTKNTMQTTDNSTETTQPDAVDQLEGEVICFLHSGLSVDVSPMGSDLWQPMERGAEIRLTKVAIASTRDRLGRSWLESLGDRGDQVRRWGRPLIVRGAWPVGADRLDPESSQWEIERQRTYNEIAGVGDAKRRTELRAAADARFGGPPGTTSKTTMHYGPRGG